jgi:hypothetical protein
MPGKAGLFSGPVIKFDLKDELAHVDTESNVGAKHFDIKFSGDGHVRINITNFDFYQQPSFGRKLFFLKLKLSVRKWPKEYDASSSSADPTMLFVLLFFCLVSVFGLVGVYVYHFPTSWRFCCLRRRKELRPVKIFVLDSHGFQQQVFLSAIREGESSAEFRKRVMAETGAFNVDIQILDTDRDAVELTDHTPLMSYSDKVESVRVRRRRTSSDEKEEIFV